MTVKSCSSLASDRVSVPFLMYGPYRPFATWISSPSGALSARGSESSRSASSSVTVSSDIVLKSDPVRGLSVEPSSSTSLT